MAIKLFLGFFISLNLACVVAKDITVETALGNITGEEEELTFDATSFNVTKFLGIPFAEPPIGTRRFNKPTKKSSLSGEFVAKTMPPICIQSSVSLLQLGIDPESLNQSEDCLYLNIFIPGSGPVDKTRNLATMIWIFGGGFQFGFQDWYDAKALVGLNDIILVTFNYRVSFLGFLSTSEDNRSGNYGLWDQHMAIQWVHDHITYFGGDPTRVTLFGESAGASSVVYQAFYAGNEGLFQRVIAQSGSTNVPWAYENNPGSVYMNFANKTGCLTESQLEIINCLRQLNVSEIMNYVGHSDEFQPVKDGHFVEIHPVDLFKNTSTEAWDMLRKFGKLDFIFGVTSSEGGENLYFLDSLANASSGLTPTGYSREAFETSIVSYALKSAKLRNSRALRAALIHQYGDWVNPDNEDTIFANTIDLFSDLHYNADVLSSVMAHSNTGEVGKLYFYVFDYKGLLSNPRLSGASHADELAYVMGFPETFASYYDLFGLTVPQAELDFSRKLMEYWTNFAKTGDPNTGNNPSTLTTWPEYDTDTQKYIRFRDGADFPVEDHFAASRVQFWHDLIPVMSKECDKVCPKCTNKVSGATSLKMTLVLIVPLWTVILL